MIKLYGGRAGTSLRCHWLLHEVKAEYEHVAVDFASKQHKSPEFLRLNPMGQVPVLVDGDLVLAESLAINNYIAEKFQPELLGKTIELRAQVYQWSLWSMFAIGNRLGDLFGYKMRNELTPEIIKATEEKVAPYFQMLDDRLAGKDFLVGDSFTVADINVAITISYADAVGCDYQQFVNVVRWLKQLMTRPAFLAAKQG